MRGILLKYVLPMITIVTISSTPGEPEFDVVMPNTFEYLEQEDTKEILVGEDSVWTAVRSISEEEFEAYVSELNLESVVVNNYVTYISDQYDFTGELWGTPVVNTDGDCMFWYTEGCKDYLIRCLQNVDVDIK